MKINTHPETIWFTSDTHGYHRNITRGVSDWGREGTRDYDTIEEMTSAVINGLNKYINPTDTLFHLGDWTFGGIDKIYEFRKQINCENIHLLFGNHDHRIINNAELPQGMLPQSLFVSTQHYLELTVGKKLIILMHYPIQEWNNRPKESIHLHGHSHGNIDKKPFRLDVGIDAIFKLLGEYRPINLSEIIEILK